MLKVLAFLSGGKVVWLEDYDGKLTRSIAYKVGNRRTARRFWFIHKAVLEEDFTVSFPRYVSKWKFE